MAGSGGFLVEGGFEIADRGEIPVPPAEEFDDLHGRAVSGERVHLENLQRLNTGDAAVGIFLQQCVEDGAGLVAILGEDVALFHLFGALLPRERRGVESNMADEIERVVVAAHLLGEFIEEDSLGGEFLQDGLLLLSVIPDGEEGIEEA